MFSILGAFTVSFSGVSIQNGEWLPGAGGGISNEGGTLTVTDSTISGNTVGFNGGGIFNTGTLTVTNSTISGNMAGTDGSGISNTGTLTVTNSTISGNTAGTDGGGISNTGTLTASNSNLSGNTAVTRGGGIYTGVGTATVSNSTISGNTVNFGGGIFHLSGTTTVTNTTIASNSANITSGGIYSNNIGSVTLTNTIVANQTSGANCFGTITSAGHNLESANSCLFAGAGDLTTTNPLLVALANNGGATQTMALSAGSPAINAADNAVCNNPPVSGVDQRGIVRPQGSACDIGAYEYVPAVAPPTPIPTLSGWGMILLSCLLALGTIFVLRRQRQ